MSLLTVSPTKSDFDNCDWNAVMRVCEKAECHQYSTAFHEAAKEADDNGNTVCRDVFILLSAVTSLMFNPDSSEEPFEALYRFADGRSPILDDFTKQHLDTLAEIIYDSTSSELTARIADVLWLRRHADYQMAVRAVESYLDAATTLLAGQHWIDVVKKIERALQLAASLGKNNPHYNHVLRFIEDELQARNCSTSLYLCANLLRLSESQNRLQRDGDGRRRQRFEHKLMLISPS